MAKIKEILIAILLVFAINCSSAQITFAVKGILSDSVSMQPLPYANILVKSINDTILRGSMSNEKGEFFFEHVYSGDSAYLLISRIGYNEKKINLLSHIAIDNQINLGKIYIKPSLVQLKEFTVEGMRRYVEKRIDRKIYNISESQVAAARTVLDLLRVLPGVVVSEDGVVYFKGAEAIIYVDDQLMKFIYPKIEMIPIDKIDKVELIDIAMQTGGNGRGGIINIKFKSVNIDGFSGMVSSNIGTVKFTNFDKSRLFLNLNYKHKKFTYFLNSSIENNILEMRNIENKKILIFEEPILQNKHEHSQDQRFGSYNYLGIVFNPSKNTKFYMTTRFLLSKSSGSSEHLFTEYTESITESSNNYLQNTKSIGNQLNNGISMSYWQKFDTLDSHIKVFADFTIYNGSNNNNTDYRYHKVDKIDVDSLYKESNKQNFYTKSIYLTTSYNHSFSKKTRLNLSYTTRIGIQDTSVNKHYIFDNLNLYKSQFANNFDQLHNFSFRIGTRLGKWTLDGGATLSGMFIHGNYLRYNLYNEDTMLFVKKKYLKFLPSITIVYAISNSSDVKLTLSKTTDFPYFKQLFDYVDEKKLYYWSSGNSALKPVDFYSIYIGYMFDKENLNISTECFFNYTNNDIVFIDIPISSLVILSKPENISQKTNTGIDFSMWYKLNKRINFSISGSLFHSYYNLESLMNTAQEYGLSVENIEKRQFGYYIKCNMEFNIKGFYAMLYVNYYAKELIFDGYKNGYLNSSFSLSKKLFNNKLRITVGMNNLFDNLITHKLYLHNLGVMSTTQSFGYQYVPNYFLSIQYNFLSGDRGTKDLR